MAEDFDIGPLTWVKDEIDQALKSVLENLATVSANPEDVAALRFSKTHLYQVNGALDIVGLEGCKRFCAEIEKLADKLEKRTAAVSPEVLETVSLSVRALSAYLQDLLNGAPDVPLKLMPLLRSLTAAQGETVEDGELFFPDTSLRAPKNLPTIQLDDAALAAFVVEQRGRFQKALLNWLKSASAESLEEMRSTIDNVQQVQQQPALKTLWWVAGALMDALPQPGIAGNAGVKRICRRLDQQLRSLSEGAVRASTNLLRDLLYYVAISAAATDRIAKVKEVFELDHLLPGNEAQALGERAEADAQLLEQLDAMLASLKDIWVSVSEGKAGALDEFLQKLGGIIAPSRGLANNVATQLLDRLYALAASLNVDAGKMNEAALIEVAAGLNLLEDFIHDGAQLDAAAGQRLAAHALRLQDLMGGGAAADLPGASVSAGVDGDVLMAVAQQIKNALVSVEQALDAYFRNPAEPQVLQAAGKPLNEVAAAFDILDMPLPTAIARACLDLVGYFHNEAQKPNQALFELVAESLSLLGFYVEDLPRIRPESQAVLESAHDKLDLELQRLGLAESMEPPAVSAPEEEAITTSATPAAAQAADEGQITDRAFDDELLDIYLTEAEEVLANVTENLRVLRTDAADHGALAEVRRGFHTLKGSGRTVGLVALGEAAWAVEKLLNLVMDRKLAPTAAQLAFVEHVSAAFTGWVETLRQASVVVLDPQQWQQQALALENESVSPKAAAVSDEVIIGGVHTISRGLFNVFIGEAEQHLQALRQYLAGLSVDSVAAPHEASRRAAHTLASNALTAGFKSIGNLGRALEHWLDVHANQWSPADLALFDQVVNALTEMLRKAGQLRQPRQVSNLLTALEEATAGAGSANEGGVAGVSVIKPDIAKVASTEELPASQANAEVEPIEITDVVVASAPELTQVAEPVSSELEAAANTAANQELLDTFMEEAAELVPRVGNELRAWRSHPKEADHPDALQRTLHTLKGSARMAGQAALGDIVHDMESRAMLALKNKAGATDMDFEEMFADLDRIGNLLQELTGLHADGRAADSAGKPAAIAAGRSSDRRAQYLRLRADVLDRLINEAGEISIARSRMDQEIQALKLFSLDLTESVSRLRNHLREMEIEAESQLQSRMTYLQETNETFDPLEFDRFTRLQELTRMMAESVNDVATIQHSLLTNLDETESALQQQNRMNRELQHGLMNVRMVPFSLISERLQSIVRQTARELDKRVEMNIDGEDVQIDRSVLDKIGAPLEHLLRNAVAHGMETPAQRKKSRKPQVGHITLKVRQENDEIALAVSDDGTGINLERVREKAVQNGLFKIEQEVSEEALLSVIFEPGFSTASEISQIAGRGVGLDAVRSDITALGGRVDVSNAPSRGAVFSIYLPVTLSVSQVVLVRAGARILALPSVMVEQVQKLKQTALAMSAQTHHTWADRQYPLHFLGKLIGDADYAPEEQRYTPLLLLRSGTHRIALHVDEILGNREVVMKAIGPQLARVPGMIGATVMGDGGIVLIVNPVQLANREALASASVKVQAIVGETSDMPMVMIVDDSLTMRKVLGRLLEREGYRVVTAKDGMDAMQQLQENVPDIMLTDIEMPRMDGFELVRNVRDDSRTANLPLIMISSRTAEKHRNLAQELGVNAFLGKPVQDDALMAQIAQLLGRAMPVAEA